MTGWLERKRQHRQQAAEAEVRQKERAAEDLERLTNPPSGYSRAKYGDLFIPLVCHRCGASVADSAAALHDKWHEAA